jgi:hypothetical protein
MDPLESVIEMSLDEPAALEEAAVFSRHRTLPVGCIGLIGFNSRLVLSAGTVRLKCQPVPSACHIAQGGSQRLNSAAAKFSDRAALGQGRLACPGAYLQKQAR